MTPILNQPHNENEHLLNQTPKAEVNTPRTNGMTADQLAKMIARIEQNKQNDNYPAYIERGREAIAEYRRQLQEQLERELAAENEGK